MPAKPGRILLVEGVEDREVVYQFCNYRSKALIHTWLAWQEDPGTPLGLAVTKRYLDGDHALAQQFVQWLLRLFPTS